eukprot:jgi/Ulvmu1/9515/UM053_0003.1
MRGCWRIMSEQLSQLSAAQARILLGGGGVVVVVVAQALHICNTRSARSVTLCAVPLGMILCCSTVFRDFCARECRASPLHAHAAKLRVGATGGVGGQRM